MAKDLLTEFDGDDLADPAPPGRPAPPPFFPNLTQALGQTAFQVRGELIDLWFERGSDVLVVTFDNLASVGQYDPPQPWLLTRTKATGASILGLIAHRKDWYRNPDAMRWITDLREAGFFDGFARVIFTGTSMGGYAALALSTLLKGVEVLAFSPQSTLAKEIVPFDRRYRYAQRAWDWTDLPCLDAAKAPQAAASILLAYDPFLPEDKAHAARIKGPNVRHFHLDHMGHRAIRMMRTGDALQLLLEQMVQGAYDPAALSRALKGRRHDVNWQRALMGEAEKRGHSRLIVRAAHRMLTDEATAAFAQRLLSRHEGKAPRRDSLATVPGNAVGPFQGHIQTLHRALVLPERPQDQKLAAGVLDASGTYAPLSRGWIRAGKAMPEPRLHPSELVTDLPGRHLYAGHFRAHFGHFLVESTSRLWALDHIKQPFDSILYLPYRGDTAPIARDEAPAHFFRLLGIETPVQALSGARRVEELHIPELGFGWEDRYAGSPAFHAFMRGRLAHILPDGGEKLYISRAKLNPQRGGVLCETVIEENLARLGFEIFHPERHSLEVQIARYRAARQIVALDGSALHLAAFVLDPSTKVAMILRRSRANAGDYVRQFKGFCGIDLSVIDVIARDWVAVDANRSDYRSIGELDFAALFGWLKGLGVVPPGFRPALPDQATVRRVLEGFQDKRREPFRALTPDEAFPELVED